MDFDIKRKGYSVEQVDAYIKSLQDASKQKDDKIYSLSLEIESLKQKLGKLEGKRELIVKAIYSALNKAEQIERLTKVKYDAEMARLKAFHEKWTAYYDKLLEKYPMDDDLMAVGAFNREMSETLSGPKAQKMSEEQRLSDKNTDGFDPIKGIKEYLDDDYIAATRPAKGSKAYSSGVAVLNPALIEPSDSGFSFEEALNPTDDLKDIMKDLGILED